MLQYLLFLVPSNTFISIWTQVLTSELNRPHRYHFSKCNHNQWLLTVSLFLSSLLGSPHEGSSQEENWESISTTLNKFKIKQNKEITTINKGNLLETKTKDWLGMCLKVLHWTDCLPFLINPLLMRNIPTPVFQNNNLKKFLLTLLTCWSLKLYHCSSLKDFMHA